MRKLIASLMVMGWFITSPAQTAPQDEPPPPSFSGRVLDIQRHVEQLAAPQAPLQSSAVNVRETATTIKVELAADILFDFDSANLRPDAENALRQVAKLIHERAQGEVTIDGHTDSKGRPAYNQALSLARAKSVRDWLMHQEGLGGVQMTTVGHGATQPVAPNTLPGGKDNPAGRQKNRRVEITIRK